MKKIISVLLCIAISLALYGCGKSKDSNKLNYSTSDASSYIAGDLASAEGNKASALNKKTKADTIARKLINALENNNIDELNKYIVVSDKKAFDIIKDINFKDFKIFFLENKYNEYSYKVNFNTDCTDENLFKQDNNEYRLVIKLNDDGTFKVTDFINDNSYILKNGFSSFDAKIKLCELSEYIANEYPLLENNNLKGISLEKYKEKFDIIACKCIKYYTYATGRDYNLTPYEINNFYSDNFGLKNFDIRNSNYYDKNTNKISSDWLGAETHYVFSENHAYPLNDSKAEITIDYYADSASFIKSKTIKYTVSGEENKDFNIISRTIVYDNKLPIMINS